MIDGMKVTIGAEGTISFSFEVEHTVPFRNVEQYKAWVALLARGVSFLESTPRQRVEALAGPHREEMGHQLESLGFLTGLPRGSKPVEIERALALVAKTLGMNPQTATVFAVVQKHRELEEQARADTAKARDRELDERLNAKAKATKPKKERV